MTGVSPRRWHTLAGALLAASLLVGGCDRAPGPPGPEATEILWDRFGIPHIYGESAEELLFAHGWAQMEAHGDLLLELYGRSRGRAAEYWGPEHLADDRLLHTLGLPALGDRWLDGEEGETRGLLEAFVQGVNAYADAHREELGDHLHAVLPVEAADPLRQVARVAVLDFVLVGWEEAAGRWREGDGPESGVVQDTPPPASSTAWAVGPSHSTTGNALLLANPHLPWSGRHTLFEVHLVGPGVDVYGVSLVGFPLPVMGFNDHMSWTHTVGSQKAWDLFELQVEGGGYRWGGETEAFEMDTVALAARGPDGSQTTESVVIRRSLHGPVVERQGRRALALRFATPGMEGAVQRWWELIRAETLEEFEGALARIWSPNLTTTYADTAGNVLHHPGWGVPVRSGWTGEHWTEPLDGADPARLWTASYAYDDLPRILNPPSGWLQNSNEPPWFATLQGAPDPTAYPPYMARSTGPTAGAQRSLELLRDGPVGMEELVARKHSTRITLADRVLPDLLEALEGLTDPFVVRARSALQGWDGTADAESVGSLLFVEWARSWLARVAARSQGGPEGESPFREPWTEDRPLETPHGIADVDEAVEVLGGVARNLEGTGVALDRSWGEAYRIRRDTVDLAASGAPGGLGYFEVGLGSLRRLDFRPDPGGGWEAAGGDSWILAVEMNRPPRAQAVLAYGNASREGSPHRTDQVELFASHELRPVWRAREEVEANLLRRHSF